MRRHWPCSFFLIAVAALQLYATDNSSPDSLFIPSPPLESEQNSSHFYPGRAAIFGGAVLASYGVAYGIVFSKGWWDDPGNKFHFENDFDYALNIDKFGHAYSGLLIAEFFYDGLRWSGLSENVARGWAAGGAFLTHVAIDLKDGYAPSWGFSVWDVLAGTAGGVWPWLQELYSPLDAVDFKASYYFHSSAYWEKGGSSARVFTDDYANWTFWFSWKVYRALPQFAQKFWPEWLAIAVGFSLNDPGVLALPEGKRELYLAFDYDLNALFKPSRPLTKRIVRWFNMVKFPAPAVRIAPSGDREWFLLYPIQF